MVSQAGLVLQHRHQLLGQLALVRQQRGLHVHRLAAEAREERPDLREMPIDTYIYNHIIIYIVWSCHII